MTNLRELEFASLEIEKGSSTENSDYEKWLKMLIAPGGSLGGARPKASVVDPSGAMWIAKFPARNDVTNIGAWEMVVHQLAEESGIFLPEARVGQFTSTHHTFLVKRFDRNQKGQRIFFISAMTALGRSDGDDASTGVSYPHLAELLQKYGEMRIEICENSGHALSLTFWYPIPTTTSAITGFWSMNPAGSSLQHMT